MAWILTLSELVAQAAPAAGAAPPVAEGGWWFPTLLAVAAALVAGSFGLGEALARSLRMKDYGLKIGLVIFTLAASIVICVAKWPPKLGPDLSGGVRLIYEVDKQQLRAGGIENSVQRINSQLNSGRTEKIIINLRPDLNVEVALPKDVDAATTKARIEAIAMEASSPLALAQTRHEGNRTVLVFRPAQEGQTISGEMMNDLVGAINRRVNPGGLLELTIRKLGADQVEVIIPEVDEQEIEQIKTKISSSGLLEFRIVANLTDHKDIITKALESPGRAVYDGDKAVARWVKLGKDEELRQRGFITRPGEHGETEVLVVMDKFNVEGGELSSAAPGHDDHGNPCVLFSFKSLGAQLFGALTSSNVPDPGTGHTRQLGIVLDGELLSAPNIQETITGSGRITGKFTQKQVELLVEILNAGKLPAALNKQPISQQTISPLLGEDTIKKGELAMVVSTGAILLFMLVYYRFAGIVADIAVVLNVVITVAIMILFKAAFTLPGLAGLVLTVGMAVDANVLIYERMREESARGASLRMAIRNGFLRATATIVDSNLTTLITAIVLYIVGTDQIKGFAVTLTIGLLVSMFTAIFVSRVIFDIAERQGWLKQIKMMQLIGQTNIDFVRLCPVMVVVSAIVIVGGLGVAAVRGSNLLDIDFTGGSSVTIVFKQPKDEQDAIMIDSVRAMVENKLPDVTVSGMGLDNLEFKIDTSDKNAAHVQKVLQETFGDKLRTYSMTVKDLGEIHAKTSEPGHKQPEVQGPALEGPQKDSTETPSKAETTAPAKAPASDKPAADSPTGKEPSQAPDSEKSKEEPEKSSRRERTREIELALAGRWDISLSALGLVDDKTSTDAGAAGDSKKPAAEQPSPGKEVKPPAQEAPPEKPPVEKASEKKPTESAVQVEAPVASSAMANPFTGGAQATLTFSEKINSRALRALIEEELAKAKLAGTRFELINPDNSFDSSVKYSDWTLRLALPVEKAKEFLSQVERRITNTPVFASSDEIGSRVANHAREMAIYAFLGSWLMIVIYVWVRFQNILFGLAAVLALIHDVLVTIGFIAVSAYVAPYLGFLQIDPFKISLSVVAALLTIVGFSINDTIVIFDRIREVRGKSPLLTGNIINSSVNQTMSRTLLTSGTVLIASVILYFVGGQGIHAFAFTMVVGVITGTYSTVYIAAPLLLWMRRPATTQSMRPTTAAASSPATR